MRVSRTDIIEPPSGLSWQQWDLLRCEAADGRSPFNALMFTQVPETLPEAEVRRRLDVLIAEEENLRTRFPLNAEGEIMPRTVPAMNALQVIDVDSHEEALSHLEKQSRTIFVRDVPESSLWQLYLCRIKEQPSLITGVFDHLIADAASLRYLSARVAGSGPVVQRSRSYPEWLARQRAKYSGDVDRVAAFWASSLGDQQVDSTVALPASKAGLTAPARTHMVRRNLPSSLGEVQALSRRQRTTVLPYVLAACSSALSRLSGDDEVVIQVAMEARAKLDLGLVGWLANQLPVMIASPMLFDPSHAFKEARTVWPGMLSHYDTPTELIRELTDTRPRGERAQAGGMIVELNVRFSKSSDLALTHDPDAHREFNNVLALDIILFDKGRIEATAAAHAQAVDRSTLEALLDEINETWLTLSRYISNSAI